MNHSAKRSKAGFTIVETMVAGAMLAAGVVGMIQVLSSGTQMLDTSRKQTIAMQIIDSEIEKLRTSVWTQVTALPASEVATVNSSDRTKLTYATSSKQIDAVVSIDPSFRVTRAIADVSGKTNFKLVTLTVTWTGNTGQSHTRKGSTYVAKDGLYVSYRR